ncbi:MAG: BrnT family toxin [Thermodesulfobacteriota bacterium]|nr:BrnT family toxin [Thermodesulfobacteriota bacterium]
MIFEWDENKNNANIRNHGIDFNDVIEIFSGPMIVNLDDRFDYGEDRLFGIGFMNNVIAIVVFIEKKADVIRIISSRRANKNECQQFKKEIKNRLG